jgi:hypothetical protein
VPRYGSYVGPFDHVDLSRSRRGLLGDLLGKKRWLYAAIARDDLYIGLAITDLTYATNAFVFAARPGGSGRGMRLDRSFIGVPRGARVGDHPEEGCDAWFRLPGTHLAVHRRTGESTYELTATGRGFSLHASLETAGAPAPYGAIARHAGPAFMVTEKRALLGVTGELQIDGERIRLDGATAGLDYSQGYPPRDTAWRWGYLLGRATTGETVGLNLVEGFNGQPECVLWVGSEVIPLGEGRFRFDESNPRGPWQVQTHDGAVDLRFEVAAIHEEAHHLGVVRSRFLQPIGLYSGTIKLPDGKLLQLDAVPGVTEDQRVVWLAP